MAYFDHFKRLSATTTYSEQNALSLALACSLAYANPATITAVTASWGQQLLGVVDKKKGRSIDTQCILISDSDHIVVVFRGSDSPQDWFANFQALQDPGPLENTGAHEGFQDSLYPAVIALTRHLLDPRHGGKHLWVSGHSLGGALASLYAGMLIENGIEVYGLYTFASPRPGSPAFEQQLNQRVAGPHFRVVNEGDIVPHLPPEPFYSHPGKRIILQSTAKQTSKQAWFEQRVEALRHFVNITGQKFDIANNHRLEADQESYIPRLLKDLERTQSRP